MTDIIIALAVSVVVIIFWGDTTEARYELYDKACAKIRSWTDAARK